MPFRHDTLASDTQALLSMNHRITALLTTWPSGFSTDNEMVALDLTNFMNANGKDRVIE